MRFYHVDVFTSGPYTYVPAGDRASSRGEAVLHLASTPLLLDLVRREV